jgi:hypothetical protein
MPTENLSIHPRADAADRREEILAAVGRLHLAADHEQEGASGRDGQRRHGKPPLMSANDLNKPVPHSSDGMGAKRMLTPAERTGARQILNILERWR